jgi:hypothetical protein
MRFCGSYKSSDTHGCTLTLTRARLLPSLRSYSSKQYWMSSTTWAPTMAQYGIFDISGGDASGWSTANRRAHSSMENVLCEVLT